MALNQICRLCLGHGKLISIFSEHNSEQISSKIMSCAEVQILENDNLPSSICLKCIKRLDSSYKFKLQCEESDKKLRNDFLIQFANVKPDISIESNDINGIVKDDITIANDDSCHNSEPEYIKTPRDKTDNNKFPEQLKDESSPILRKRKSVDTPVKTKSSNEDIEKSSKVNKTRGRKKVLDESLLNVDDTILEKKFLESKMLEDIKKREIKAQKRKEKKDREKALKSDISDAANGNESKIKSKGKTKIQILQEEKEKRLLLRKSKLNLNNVSLCGNNQCYTCGKIVSSRFRLKMHMRTHTGERPYSCSYCSKTFALAQNLKVHERTHTGEKPLLCVICGKRFAQSAGLVAHTRLHTGETPYRCDICPSSFRTPGHLQYHIRQHTGEKNFECSICNRAFITKGDLTQHQRTHTGERPYVCTVCGLRMSRSSHLTRHMLTHTGEKPHKCHICSTAYAQKGDLVRHIKKHGTSSELVDNKNLLPNTFVENQQSHIQTTSEIAPSTQTLQENCTSITMTNSTITNNTVLSMDQNRLITIPVIVQTAENSDIQQNSSVMVERVVESRNVLDNRNQIPPIDTRTLGLSLGLGLLHTHHTLC